MHIAPELVSIVIPTYNGAQHVGATIRSLGRQVYENIEVIVVDDGSSDETLRVVEQSEVPIQVVSQPNLGVAVARNRGLAHANGRWVGFIDQDDLWRADRIANLVRSAHETGALAVASTEHPFALESDRDALHRVGDGREHWPKAWIAEGGEDDLTTAPPTLPRSTTPELITTETLLGGAAMLTTAVLYDRETAMAAGGFAPHARALDDHILNLNVTRIAGPIVRIDTRDLLYRVHPTSTTTVSPMALPLLSSMAAVRLGGVFPDQRHVGPNVEHLLRGLADTELPPIDQFALLSLSVPRSSRVRWTARWAKRLAGRAIRGGRR